VTRRDLAFGLLGAGAALWLAHSPVSAQVYTRRNANGVVEATNLPDATDFRLAYPGKGTLIHSRGFRRAYNGQFDPLIDEIAAANSLSPDLVRAVIAVESEFDQFAVSSKGAQGLMQLMPFTARRFGVSTPFDARQNISGGCQYLRYLLDLFANDLALTLAGYNAGENAVLRFRGIPPYKETRAYVEKVQGYFGGGWSPETAVPAPRAGATASPAGATPAAFYAPSRSPVESRPRAKTALTPAKPAVYYKWTDPLGHLNVAHHPPDDGVVYTMIRAME
jgi:hypothetical protein